MVTTVLAIAVVLNAAATLTLAITVIRHLMVTNPTRSETDVLRAAADRFRRAARSHEPDRGNPDSKRWWDAYSEAADCLETWAINGGVPPLSERAKATHNADRATR